MALLDLATTASARQVPTTCSRTFRPHGDCRVQTAESVAEHFHVRGTRRARLARAPQHDQCLTGRKLGNDQPPTRESNAALNGRTRRPNRSA